MRFLRRPVTMFAAVTLSAAALGCTNTDHETTTTRTAPHPQLDDNDIVVLLDGWSAVGVRNDRFRFSAGDTLRNVTFTPATPELVRLAEERAPGVIERLAARLVSADTELVCDTERCHGRFGDVDVDTLVSDPAHIPGFGSMYEAWGVVHGVWIATIPATSGHLFYGNERVLVTNATRDDDIGNDRPRTGVHTIGVGFGKPFHLDPVWLSATPAATERRFAYGAGDPALLAELAADPATFARGLGTGGTAVSQMTAAQLTYRTSPTTGCGVGVVCVPGVADVTVDDVDSGDTFEVCTDSGETATALPVSFTVSVNVPAPVHQFGLWDGRDPDGSIPGSGTLWATAPPLQEDSFVARYDLIHLVSGDAIVEFGGRVDGDAVAVDGRLGPEHLGRLFGGTFRVCP